MQSARSSVTSIPKDGNSKLPQREPDATAEEVTTRELSVSLERVAADTTMLREQVGGIEARLDEMVRGFERLSQQLARG